MEKEAIHCLCNCLLGIWYIVDVFVFRNDAHGILVAIRKMNIKKQQYGLETIHYYFAAKVNCNFFMAFLKFLVLLEISISVWQQKKCKAVSFVLLDVPFMAFQLFQQCPKWKHVQQLQQYEMAIFHHRNCWCL